MNLNIIELLREPHSKFFVVPLVTAFLSVLAKIISQNDRIIRKSWIEYFYLAPNLLCSNFLVICCEFSKFPLIDADKQTQFSDMCVSALLMNIALSCLICMYIRYRGWEESESRIRVWRGIIFPDLAALGVMYLVFKMISI